MGGGSGECTEPSLFLHLSRYRGKKYYFLILILVVISCVVISTSRSIKVYQRLSIILEMKYPAFLKSLIYNYIFLFFVFLSDFFMRKHVFFNFDE